jgi:hypothetical protein
VSQSPAALEVLATVWTMRLLALRLAPMEGSLLHPMTIRRDLHRLGCRRPKPKHESPRIGHFSGLLKRNRGPRLKDETNHLGGQLLSPSLGVES